MSDRNLLILILCIWPLVVVAPLWRTSTPTAEEISLVRFLGTAYPIGWLFCLFLNWIGARTPARRIRREFQSGQPCTSKPRQE